jgi:phosphoribosyl-ATP pyrophosphohydrolase
MKNEIKKGSKLKSIKDRNNYETRKKWLTKDGIYEVVRIDNLCFYVIDDENEPEKFGFHELYQYFELVKEKSDPIVESVVSKFLQRSKVGIDKYGTTLHENNVDCFLEHTQLELMDAVNYIEKLKSQRNESIQSKVIQWANERQIVSVNNAPKQIIKLTEEVGELASAFLKSNDSELKDAIGDIMIVLTILCKQLSIDMNQCYADAYEIIKDRTGKTIDGSFVKD